MGRAGNTVVVFGTGLLGQRTVGAILGTAHPHLVAANQWDALTEGTRSAVQNCCHTEVWVR
eukprot:1161224-Pelagomonas_calceolata.AAC.3